MHVESGLDLQLCLARVRALCFNLGIEDLENPWNMGIESALDLVSSFGASQVLPLFHPRAPVADFCSWEALLYHERLRLEHHGPPSGERPRPFDQQYKRELLDQLEFCVFLPRLGTCPTL